MSQVIGFVGMGIMGRPMLENVIKAGYEVVAYDLNAKALQDAVKAGAKPSDSLEDLAQKVSTVITMLPDSPDVQTVLTGDGGLATHLAEGSIVIDMSTISPHVTRQAGEELSKRDIKLLDAPVSGGQKGAIEGALSIMVGGDADTFATVEPILRTMGRTVSHLGPLGSGQIAKMCNQMIVAMNIAAICEGFALGRAEGIDLNRLREVLTGGAANSWMMENLAGKMIERDATAGFRIDLQFKDLRIAVDSAFRNNVPIPSTLLATTMYSEARAHGEGSLGNQAMFRVYDRLANQA